MEKRIIPDFESEAEEAKWWFDNQDELLKDFQQAAKEGRLRRRTGDRVGSLPTTTIRLDPVDIQLAREQAEEREEQVETLRREMVQLRREREEIRGRVEKMLHQIESISQEQVAS